jgi:hypothetical protein
MKKQLTIHGSSLVNLLRGAHHQIDHLRDAEKTTQKVHIVGAGGALTAAYEQLRNAAEYAEEHTLLQKAIQRFYRRLFLVRDTKQIKASGEELAIELTLAGYLLNDSIPEETIEEISKLAAQYYDAYEKLEQQKIPHDKIEQWILGTLSVKIEWMLNNPAITSAYLQFVYEYYLSSHALGSYLGEKPKDFELALYVALQRALLKSDTAVVRAGILSRYQQTPKQLDHFVETNKQIDALFSLQATEKIYRYIDRHGAPFRVIRHMLDDKSMVQKLSHSDEFLSRFEMQVLDDYKSINTRINNGIIKSVIFLIITKVLIGLAVEVPYDYLIFGAIAFTPLLINLFFPPVYMILLRMTLMLPGSANTQRLVEQTEQILYGSEPKELQRKATSFGAGFNVAYAMVFIIVFGGFGYLLWNSFEFELLHLFIFFLFLSGASFLGFRLSRMIREVEAVDSDQNAVTTTRDFLYMPFVVVGRYMSDKYAKVNIIALSLDMFIELPLKTVLRLIRQWGAFISSKKDEL